MGRDKSSGGRTLTESEMVDIFIWSKPPTEPSDPQTYINVRIERPIISNVSPGPDDDIDWLFVDPNNPNKDWIVVESYQIGNSQASREGGTTVAMETLTIAHEGFDCSELTQWAAHTGGSSTETVSLSINRFIAESVDDLAI
jgi:hypothetical protein